MKKYNIQITETMSRLVTLRASSEEMALRIVRDMYHDEDIVLDYADYDGVEFSVQE
jgi:hypothetical protein